MVGFAAGLGAGFSGLAQGIAQDNLQRQEMALRTGAAQRQAQLDDLKQLGELVKSYHDAVSQIPPEDTPENKAMFNQRTDMFSAQYQALTGNKPAPIALQTIKQGGPAAVNAMAQIYGQNPALFNRALTDANALTAVFDAYNQRSNALKSNQAFQNAMGGAQSTGGGAVASPVDQSGGAATPIAPQQGGASNVPPLPPEVQALDRRMNQLNSFLGTLNATTPAGQQQALQIRANLDILQKQRDQLLTGNTEQMKNDAVPLPLATIQAIPGLQVGATYGDLRRLKAGQAQPAAQPQTSGVGYTGNPMIDAVMHTESRGNQNAVSPVGAQGTMQTMPSTLTSPGFGVTPAKDNSPAEKQRVGIDYWNAMNQRYGDPALAAVAYNMGPDKTDKWIQAGGDFKKLPKETQDYVGQVMLRNGLNATGKAQQAPMQAAQAAPADTTQAQSLVPLSQQQLASREVIGQGAGKAFNDMRTAATQAQGAEGQLKTLQSLLDQAGRTGTGASTMLALRKLGQAAGFNIDPSANFAEAAQALGIHLLGQTRTAAGGVGGTSNYEDVLYKQGTANIDKLPEANKIIIGATIKQAQRTQDIFREVAKYVKTNGYDDVGVQDLIQKYVADHPVFTAEDAKYLMQGKSMAAKPNDTRPPLNSFFK